MKWLGDEGYELRSCRSRTAVEISVEGAGKFTEMQPDDAMRAALRELQRLQEEGERHIKRIAVLEQTKRTLIAQNGRQAEEIRQSDRRPGRLPRDRQVVEIAAAQQQAGGSVVAVVCDDSTVWEISDDRLGWFQLPPIPQPESGEVAADEDGEKDGGP